jgi:hypothetical protein
MDLVEHDTHHHLVYSDVICNGKGHLRKHHAMAEAETSARGAGAPMPRGAVTTRAAGAA